MNFRTIGRKIVAIGRNYAEHAKELGNQVPTAPFYFLKPTSSYLSDGESIEIPKGQIVHHELELGVVVGKGGRDIASANAMSHVAGYVLALDMTCRSLQDEAKKQARPWSMSKGFDTFTPIGSFIPKDKVKDPHALKLWLKVDDKMRQNGTTADMIFKIPALIEYVSASMTLEEGDLILTGTPSGVGPVKPGEKLIGALSDASGSELASFKFGVIARPGSGIFGSGKI
ncbi:hypothetical protein SmJEL517_g01627 [Synchytrium microbalum]|uniref:Fumarylacetoacetase-like C-terminal domain-containing protein n=1 Tax=Synchytrium microbalum TaxID=1806994 RepID=A0A507CDZ7_9FUNG|nr:uncharacterized protein SmJEL517_g01627 [Synchytrium microbalum]TPX36144.1 hypothetical protein SmJEL517_g01627 [Synchytrium microbalum]